METVPESLRHFPSRTEQYSLQPGRTALPSSLAVTTMKSQCAGHVPCAGPALDHEHPISPSPPQAGENAAHRQGVESGGAPSGGTVLADPSAPTLPLQPQRRRTAGSRQVGTASCLDPWGGLRLHRRVPSKQERLNVAGHQRVERKRPGRWGEVGAAPVPLGNPPGAARTSCEPRLRGVTSWSLFSSLVGEGAQAESRT